MVLSPCCPYKSLHSLNRSKGTACVPFRELMRGSAFEITSRENAKTGGTPHRTFPTVYYPRCHGNAAAYEKTASRKRSGFFVLALPIFPASHPASIVGADELNFCVRDGNRWTLVAINTNYCFPYTLKTEHCASAISLKAFTEPALWSSFRLISISQLHTLPCFHL